MGNGFSGTIGYVMVQKDVPQELQPKVIECNNVMQSSSVNIARQMRTIAMENERVQKPVMHMQISFHPDEKLTTEQAQKAIDSILKDIGVERNNHQFIVVEHFDKSHQHFHVVCNRVGLDTKLLNDSHLKIKLNIASDKVEKQLGLRQTDGRQYQFDINTGKGKFIKAEKKDTQSKKLPSDKNEKVKKAKETVQEKVIDVLQTAKTPEEFNQKLAEKGIEVRFSEDRTNNNAIRGASFRVDDIAIKGGDIGFSWSEINTILETNLDQEQARKIETPGQVITQTITAEEKSKLWNEYYFYKPYKEQKAIKNIPITKEEAIQEVYRLALEMKSCAAPNVNDIIVADQAIRLTMKNFNPNENPWDTWQKIAGNEIYNELHKAVKNTKANTKELVKDTEEAVSIEPMDNVLQKIKAKIATFKKPEDDVLNEQQQKRGFKL